MSAVEKLLPAFPASTDVWEMLRNEKSEILIYGMGNGADKLIKKFSEYGIKYTDIFASDGFVRGHSFHGVRVKSFSEIKEMYSDFVIVLSFASNKSDVMEMLSNINANYRMVLPDMPVAGEDEYFTAKFYNENYEKIKQTYDILGDEESKRIYTSVIEYKLSGRIRPLLDNFTEREDLYSLFPKDSIRTAVDLGAYNGDTAKEAVRYFPSLKTLYAVEPDKRNFKKLSAYAEEEKSVRIIPINAAAWSSSGTSAFSDSGNRNSSVNSTASYKHNESEVFLMTVDSLKIDADYMKYDVEGAELQALKGSAETIRENHPSLLVSLYHRSRDVFELPLYLYRKYGSEYDFYVRRLKSLPAWELDLILVKKR